MVYMTKTKAAIENIVSSHGSYTIYWTLTTFILVFLILTMTGFPWWVDILISLVLWVGSHILVQRKIDASTVAKLV